MERRKPARKVPSYHLSKYYYTDTLNSCLDSYARKLHPSNYLTFKEISEHVRLSGQPLSRYQRMDDTGP